jgi:hypothetical protein
MVQVDATYWRILVLAGHLMCGLEKVNVVCVVHHIMHYQHLPFVLLSFIPGTQPGHLPPSEVGVREIALGGR